MNRTIVSSILTVLLLTAVAVVYASWYRHIEALSAEAAALSVQIDDKQQDASRAASARRALDSIASDEATLASRFVVPQNIVSFLESIEKTGQALGTSVSVGSVSADPKPRPHLTVMITVKGTFEKVMRTVGAIEYGPQDIQVTTLSLSAATSTATGARDWVANAKLSVGMSSTTVAAKP